MVASSWGRFEITGLWKNCKSGFGCYAKRIDRRRNLPLKYAIIGDDVTKRYVKGDILQGLFEDRKDFHGTPMIYMKLDLSYVSLDETHEFLFGLGFDINAVLELYDKFANNTVYRVLSNEKTWTKFVNGSTERAKIRYNIRNMNNDNPLKQKYPFLRKSVADTLFRICGQKVLKSIAENPYSFANADDDFSWFNTELSFAEAEQIAIAECIPFDSTSRVTFLIRYAMRSIMKQNGNTVIELSDNYQFDNLVQRIRALSCKFSDAYELPQDIIVQKIVLFFNNTCGRVIEYDNRRFGILANDDTSESTIVDCMNRRCDSMRAKNISTKSILSAVNYYCIHSGNMNAQGALNMDSQQILAVVAALRNNTSIVAGGFYDDKVIVATCIAYCWHKITNGSIMIIASAGKTVQHLCDMVFRSTGSFDIYTASMATLNCFSTDAFDDTLVIVDDASIIDLKGLELLLSKAKNAHIVFMGDYNQLLSVGIGNVLHDLMASKLIPVIELAMTYNVKNKNGGVLIDNINAIASHHVEDVTYGNNFGWKSTDCKDHTILGLMHEYKCLTTLYGKKNVCILAPFKSEKDVFSTIRLNEKIQEFMFCNKKDVICTHVRYGNSFIRVNDRVVVTRDISNQGVAKGEICTVEMYHSLTKEVVVKLDSGVYVTLKEDDANYLELAYVLTVHRGQGNRYDYVLFLSSPRMSEEWASNIANRNLIYTAMTMAKKSVSLYGDKEAFEIALNRLPKKRVTLLKERLCGYI